MTSRIDGFLNLCKKMFLASGILQLGDVKSVEVLGSGVGLWLIHVVEYDFTIIRVYPRSALPNFPIAQTSILLILCFYRYM
jgi:hypothetical protein